jgi:hypothetical protein
MWGFGSYARDDLAEYRAHYPRNPDHEFRSDNVRFYRNEIKCRPEAMTIDEVHAEWAGRHRFLESCHSYIQWLFPIQESGLNPQAQVLQKHEIATMKQDPEVITRVKKSFAMMLEFYGFEMTGGPERLSPPISPLPERKWQFDNLNYSGHNYLRITRILKFLGEMGLESHKLAWLDALEKSIYDDKELPNCRSSFENYWTGTIYDDATRKTFADRVAARPPPPAPRYSSWGFSGFSGDLASASAKDDEEPAASAPPAVSAAQPSAPAADSNPRAEPSAEPVSTDAAMATGGSAVASEQGDAPSA